MKLAWLLIVILVLGVASEYNKPEPLGFEQVEFEITAIQPPTHLLLSFRNVRTGLLYEKVSIAKTCSGWKRIKVGDRVWLIEATFKEDDHEVKRLLEPDSLINTLYCRI
jgi:hypothetical protein